MSQSSLSLSENPNPELISHIEQFGGKLGVLELISKKYQENPELFDEIGIKVGLQYTPTIITAHDPFSKNVWEYFLKKHNLKNGDGKGVLLRASLPGDYRSLIDVIRTYRYGLHNYQDGGDSRSSIQSRIDSIIEKVNSSPELARYAELAGVPFDPVSLSFGLIPEFEGSCFVVTEHPNHEGQLIEEGPFEKSKPNKIFRITNENPSMHGGKVAKLLELLRSMDILDVQVAYSFELGVTPSGDLILFQIREFSQKVLVDGLSLRIGNGRHSQYIRTIMTTLQDGVQKVFQTHEFDANRYNTNSYDSIDVPKIARLGGRGRPLSVENLDPNLHGISTENMYLSVGQHENMRYIQYALGQSTGGIVFVGRNSDGGGSYSSDLGITKSSFDSGQLGITRYSTEIHIEKLP